MLRNRLQIVFFAMALLVLTGLLVAGFTAWWQRPSELTMATGPDGSAERRFAEKLSALLEERHATIRLKLLPSESFVAAQERFAHSGADLAILRTDVRFPSFARAVAILEHDPLLIIAASGVELKSIADLRGKRLVVLGDDGRNEALVRQILDLYDVDAADTPLRTMPKSSVMIDLLKDFDFILNFEPLSKIATTRAYEELADKLKGFSLFGVPDSNALSRKVPGLYAESLDAGLLSGAPRIPDEDTPTVAMRRLLMVREDVRNPAVAELLRIILASKADLGVDRRFASHIEPPETEKDSAVPAHEGAAEFVDSEVESFFERYSDVIYLVLSVGSVVGSLGLAGFTAATRVKPVKAGERAHDVMMLLDKIRAADSAPELDIVETELEDVLKEVLRGLKDGTVSAEGLDAFRMGYEHAREALHLQRKALTP